MDVSLAPLADVPACNGQPGKINPAYQRLVYVGMPSIEAVAAALGGPAVALMMAPIVGGLTFDLLTICDTPQPPDPILTQDDIVNASAVTDPLRALPAIERVRQWFVHMMWPTWCQCTDGTTPPPATSTPLPPASENPGLPSGTLPTFCQTGQGYLVNITTTATTYFTFSDPPWQLNVGTTAVRQYGDIHPPSGGGAIAGAVVLTFTVANGLGTATARKSVTIQNPSARTNYDVTLPVDASSHLVSVQVQSNVATNWVCDIIGEAYCNGDLPGVPTAPCCPPDPLVDLKLTQLQQLVTAIYLQLTQSKHDLADGVVHANLSGTGRVQLAGNPAALRVVIRDLPAGWPGNPGDPTYYYSLGYITPLSNDTPLRGTRLVYSGQTFPLNPYADGITWNLAAGLHIDIVELNA